MNKNITKGYVEGVFKYNHNKLQFDGDCIGKKIKFIYKNTEYYLCFPNFEFGKGDPKPTFDNTIVDCNWVKNSHYYNVGDVQAYSNTDNEIYNFVCNTLVVRSVNILSKTKAKKVRLHIEELKDIFINWYEICELKHVVQTSIHFDSAPEHAYFIPDNSIKKAKRISLPEDNGNIEIRMGSGNITFELTKKILKKISNSMEIDIIYLLLISSNSFYEQGRYRESLIDSATAFEFELTQLFDMKTVNLNPGQKKIMKSRVKGLAGLEEAIRILDKRILENVDVKSIITLPRNDIMHKNAHADKETAQKALDYVKAFTFKYFPLN